MEKTLLASIIISSYNYGRYLRETIDSCLEQTYHSVEVIVVDDGSTDNSREIIAGYGDRIKAILKENGGHASALNSGFAESRGDVICFLDSDDALLPSAMEEVAHLFEEDNVCTVRWQMWTMDAASRVMRKKVPADWISHGDLRESLLRQGPDHFPPTSGNAWARRFLERVLPIPEMTFRLGGGDLYLATLAPLFGLVRSTAQPQGLYRIHTDKYTLQESFRQRIDLFIEMWDRSLEALGEHGRAMAIEVNVPALKARSWWRQIRTAAEELASLVPKGETYILVEDDAWGVGEVIPGCRRRCFLDRNGRYWGPPKSDTVGIQELEGLRRSGAGFVAFVWSSYWWFDHFPLLRDHLDAEYPCILRNERVTLFDLRRPVQPCAHIAPDGGALAGRV
jgi:glycosyltransferase involved in cell wall biosynthesis